MNARIALLAALCVGSSCSPPPPGEGPTSPPPNAGRLSLECEARGLRAYDASRSLLVGPRMRCTANVGDRLGAPVSAPQVTFLTEAGRLIDEGTPSTLGKVSAWHEVAEPLPQDVVPEAFSWRPGENDSSHTGEYVAPLWMMPMRWVEDPASFMFFQPTTLREPRRPDPLRMDAQGQRINNPRDNLVTLVVVTDGEEGFVDTNANGTFDPGEVFEDLPEPFVDANDNGTHDQGEAFIDTNANSQWDAENGAWDPRTKIWASTRVLWTGVPAPQDRALSLPMITGHRPTVRGLEPIELRCLGPDCVSPASPITRTVYWADPWFNPLARLGANDTCKLLPSGTLPVNIEVTDTLGSRLAWEAGERLLITVSDVRERITTSEPKRVPPAPFSATVRCTFTPAPGATPEDVFEFTVSGSID
jgi:hypothetical protein